MSERTVVAVFLLVGLWPGFYALAAGEIEKPKDAPQPLAPAESANCVQLPEGFRLELMAAEPLVREPSGVCWDHRGRMFVCELHGYNLEGQYDIEELNQTGKLDRIVRRIQANPRAKAKAEKETFGTVKLLLDTDRDGVMDKAHVWADNLPPCYGICPANDGVIVACAPHIVFLADRDGDGRAEIRETLFTGFQVGALERGISCPQWGADNWIYFGRGAGGGNITGPRLEKPVELPRTDFRIQADGSAIEPVTGGTHTFGFAISEFGERFVVSTGTPGLFVAPLPWRYLARNPNVAVPRLDINAANYQQVYPISKPHPWRTKRAEDPGFSKYYTDRYGIAESAPNGYFTSCCSPMVYQDAALPGLAGQLLACEPAQNLIHRANIDRTEWTPRLRRPQGEEQQEFLASSDTWFHPMAMSHAPDGSVVIVDFYREIIEDYSAIPRYLQQQYGLKNGQNFGRIWRLTHRGAPKAALPDMSGLDSGQLVRELQSQRRWRRETAQRLLLQRNDRSAAKDLKRMVGAHLQPVSVVRALYTLDAIQELGADDANAAMRHDSAEVRVHGLRMAERFFDGDRQSLDAAVALSSDKDPRVLLQLAMSLGQSGDPRIVPVLAQLIRQHDDVRWMTNAVLSSLDGRGAAMLAALLKTNDQAESPSVLLSPLCASIAASRDAGEISQALVQIGVAKAPKIQVTCLGGLRSGFNNPVAVAISDPARQTLRQLATHNDRQVRASATSLIVGMRVESEGERKARLEQTLADVADVQLPVERRLAAVDMLSAENERHVTSALLTAFANSTPRVRKAILDAMFSDRQRLPALVEALEKDVVAVSALTALQRIALLDHHDAKVRAAASKLFKDVDGVGQLKFVQFAAALKNPRNAAHGEVVFRQKCATCHQAHGIGFAVGPDLSAEFQRAEETIVKDILAPSDAIAAGYVTYVVETTEGRVISGLLAVESAGSITLRQAEGKQLTLLRKNIENIKALNVSLMPEELAKVLEPADVANVIAWLREPPARRVLFDDDARFIDLLTDGEGRATLEGDDVHRGLVALRVTPPQRFSAKMDGWQFKIREKPAAGEYRYLRLAWKSAGAAGVMVELANQGAWPPAELARFRYYAGTNTTGWAAVQVSQKTPAEWTTVTRDLWKDFGDSTITGIAPTAMGGAALFDSVELLRETPARK